MTPDVRAQLRRQLKRDEGTGPTKDGIMLPYKCPAGFLTIGYGHNLDANGLKPKFAEYLLDDDIDDVGKELIAKLPWLETVDDTRRAVVIAMAFNMGVQRLMSFDRMLEALRRHDYETASVEMLDSLWAQQVKGRSLRLAGQMLRGEFQW
jgi:lysozyme